MNTDQVDELAQSIVDVMLDGGSASEVKRAAVDALTEAFNLGVAVGRDDI
jgi:hypothetical protein